MLRQLGRDPNNYHVYGGVGPTNFNFAKIPWVAVCDTSVSSGAQYGYFIVLLFTEAMDGCFLSLNQGYTQYRESFGTNTLALKQIGRTASACAYFLNPDQRYTTGSIDLKATLPMGRGYERGAIVSRYYSRAEVTETDIRADFQTLLSMYDRLIDRVGRDIMAFSPPVSEDEFQAAAAAAAESNPPEPPPGPQTPPPLQGAATRGRYRRDPNMAGLALSNAGFRCEVDGSHASFKSERTGERFVEAHHLFPMGVQAKFQVSLDVPENIISLCPTCHRMLHHGVRAEKRPVLTKLWKQRSGGLVLRGISEPLNDLLRCYATELGDGD